MTRKSIIIADDHPVFRLGLAHIINRSVEFAVIAEAENAKALLDQLHSLTCHILILDIKMPGNQDGMAALRTIKTSYPHIKVLIMSQMCSVDLVNEAMALGADGYVSKNDIADLILPYLKIIDKGEKALSSRIQSMMMGVQSGMVEKLTPRETVILRLSVQGLRRNDIARRLNISSSTVNFHRRNIKEKLQTNSLAGMIRIAYEKGLV